MTFLRSIQHCKENPIYVFPFWKLRSLSPSFHIPRINTHISCSRIGRSIMRIYKSLTDTWLWKLGLWTGNSSSGNFCFQFSVLGCFAMKDTTHVDPIWPNGTIKNRRNGTKIDIKGNGNDFDTMRQDSGPPVIISVSSGSPGNQFLKVRSGLPSDHRHSLLSSPPPPAIPSSPPPPAMPMPFPSSAKRRWPPTQKGSPWNAQKHLSTVKKSILCAALN